jgi:hypothetical protein
MGMASGREGYGASIIIGTLAKVFYGMMMGCFTFNFWRLK